ncbi:Bacterial hemoglobin [Aquimixticola soesokkakensis]|uniref:Bacterial hemoglobin n=1 Tax=Aquimixticola soesokkakensis TaxID=1519096 RepID=A0A1Y5SZI4_9RHOB|nr:globin domain-containing protein [Aquimixticola soesokkakensis]SLN52301.1 Bacterial hemoglobin [Aquimixticola soesokkakensis]
MLTADKTALVRTSFQAVFSTCPELLEEFYTRLFVVEPSVRQLFPKDISTQALKLEATMQLALSALEAPESLIEPLRQMGADHRAYGVSDGQYHIVCEVLMDTLAAHAGDTWTRDTSAAWGEVLSFISNTMIEGARIAPPSA